MKTKYLFLFLTLFLAGALTSAYEYNNPSLPKIVSPITSGGGNITNNYFNNSYYNVTGGNISGLVTANHLIYANGNNSLADIPNSNYADGLITINNLSAGIINVSTLYGNEGIFGRYRAEPGSGSWVQVVDPTSSAPSVNFVYLFNRKAIVGYDEEVLRALFYNDVLSGGIYLFNDEGIAIGSDTNSYSGNIIQIPKTWDRVNIQVNVTALNFIGSGLYLTNISTVMNYTNLAMTNQTNNFTQNQTISVNSTNAFSVGTSFAVDTTNNAIGIGFAPSPYSLITAGSLTKPYGIGLNLAFTSNSTSTVVYGADIAPIFINIPTSAKTITGVRMKASHAVGDGGNPLTLYGGVFAVDISSPNKVYNSTVPEIVVGGKFSADATKVFGVNIAAPVQAVSGWFTEPNNQGNTTALSPTWSLAGYFAGDTLIQTGRRLYLNGNSVTGQNNTFIRYNSTINGMEINANSVVITGATQIGSSLNVTGNVTINNNLNTTNNVYIGGNLSVKRPYWVGYDNSTQPLINVANAQVINISNNADIDKYGINVKENQNLTFDMTGDYVCTLSPEFFEPAGQSGVITFWMQKNGVDVKWSNSRYTLASNSYNAPAITYQFDISNPATDNIRFMWWSDNANTILYSSGALTSPTRPSIPAVLLNCFKVSEIT